MEARSFLAKDANHVGPDVDEHEGTGQGARNELQHLEAMEGVGHVASPVRG